MLYYIPQNYKILCNLEKGSNVYVALFYMNIYELKAAAAHGQFGMNVELVH